MPGGNDDEFSALRNRAYGPAADIHDDPEALGRLRHLEGEAKRHEIPERPQTDPGPTVERNAPSAPAGDEPPQSPAERIPSWPERAYRAVRHARRSSVLVGIGVFVVIVSVLTAVTLVQRVQVDPLQAGATQVARLQLDEGYQTPAFFSAGAGEVIGFEEFHGLRTVITTAGFFAIGGSSNDSCLSIFSEADMREASSGSFSGQALGGCAAGRFPAMVQFRPDSDGYPADLRAAFPGPAALQFVYDQATNEIVVFAETD
ncbi:hypothetical protein B7R21_07825 [Subtercola boreus]|uniref:Uncharacterized protein n=1 Tax=Subtercola boreus TaxID=120213 RepID=A0A3E0VWM9_9MICO|nr:hypothetical protein [Subtercola boreus]RFA13733.1 hypothetical protein B7R21_07825 [Subtercola boreus]